MFFEKKSLHPGRPARDKYAGNGLFSLFFLFLFYGFIKRARQVLFTNWLLSQLIFPNSKISRRTHFMHHYPFTFNITLDLSASSNLFELSDARSLFFLYETSDRQVTLFFIYSLPLWIIVCFSDDTWYEFLKSYAPEPLWIKNRLICMAYWKCCCWDNQ